MYQAGVVLINPICVLQVTSHSLAVTIGVEAPASRQQNRDT